MKNLFIFLLLIQFASAAQDTNSISFGTETVEEFRKQSLMDEYERAFGGDKKVNTRFKIGLTGFPNSKYSPTLPFVFMEQRIGKRLSLGLGGIISTRENSFPQLGRKALPDENLKVSLNAEMRYYLKGNKTLSGNYLGLEFKKSRMPLYLAHGIPSFINKPYYLKSQFSLNAGKQFGPLLDIGLQIGIKNILKPEIDKGGFVNIDEDYAKSFTPFIGAYSKIGLGIDFPFTKKQEINSCEFLNCFTEFEHLFKVNLSNLFYLDPYYQNLKLDVAYEQKLGKLPLSFNLDAIVSLGNERNYKPVKTEATPENPNPPFSYETRRKNETLFAFNYTLQMRYYFLQKRSVAKGKGAHNLSGVYGGLFYTRFVKVDDTIKFIRVSFQEEFPFSYPKFASGLTLGIQKKILKNYYYDFSIKYNVANPSTPLYSRFNQDIKFGYSF